MSSRTMKQIPKETRPYEKSIHYGVESLTDAELLAVILKTGTCGVTSVDLAKEILTEAGGDTGLSGIHNLTIPDLCQIRGIGQVKAIQIKCIGELSKRIAQSSSRKSIVYNQPSTIAEYYMEQLRHEQQEILICMMLDTKNHLIGERMISKGTVNASLISPRELFLAALSFQAVNIILVHNHPSGDSTPSQEDIAITRRIQSSGNMLDIHLLDHIIIGDCNFFSFCEKDLLLT